MQPTIDRRSFLSTSALLLTSIGCREGTKETRQSLDSFLESKKILTDAGYQVDDDSSVDRQTENILFILGDVHDSYYRQESIKLIEFLRENSIIDRIGIEGLHGEPRASIFEDRYLLISKLIGPEASARIKEQEKELLDPLLPLLDSQSAAEGSEFKVFGLEEESEAIRSEYISRQLEMLTAILHLLSNQSNKFLRQPISQIIEQLPQAQDLILDLEAMTTRVKTNKELADLMLPDTPHFSRGLFLDIQKLAAYQEALDTQKLEHIINIRNEKFRQQITTNLGKKGIIAYAGWIHADYLSQHAELSSIVINPIRDHKKDLEYQKLTEEAKKALKNLRSGSN